jgi:glycosyltransferase involved in cell wall biosynthesis
MTNITNQSVPVFIISFNRLSYLETLVDTLESRGFENLIILDNASTYAPLLQYLEQSPHRVVRLDQNLGHLALWRSGKFNQIIERQRFILTDCDVVPAPDCPSDVTPFLNAVLDKYPNHTKAGLSLSVDDLPDHYRYKQRVIDWEKPFWETRLDDGHYEGAIDTTFALYRPNVSCDEDRWWRSIRTAPPYSAQHLPWYENTSIVSDEELYYQRHVKGISTQWSITDPDLLKQQNTELQHEIAALKKEIALLKASQKEANQLKIKGLIIRCLRKANLLSSVERVQNLARKYK